MGEQVLLRDYAAADDGAVAAYQSDPRYLQFSPPEEARALASRELVELFLRWAAETPRQNHQLAIVHRGTGLVVGSVGLRSEGSPPGSAEFGLELSPDWWGRGLASEAARLLLDFGFESLGLAEVLGVAVTENARVAALVRRLGFTDAGRRPGEAWMTGRGWTYTEWRLPREAWRGRPGGAA